jgi:hypothetical protein
MEDCLDKHQSTPVSRVGAQVGSQSPHWFLFFFGLIPVCLLLFDFTKHKSWSQVYESWDHNLS